MSVTDSFADGLEDTLSLEGKVADEVGDVLPLEGNAYRRAR
jgi:hypothetical protein